MFDRLTAALRLVQEEFADSSAGDAWLSDEQLADRVETAQRVMNAAAAVQALRVAQYAAREDVRHEDGTWSQRDRPLGHLNEFASGVIGPALGLSPAGADKKVGLSAQLASTMAPTLRSMAAGDLDEWRASVLTRELADAAPEVAAEVQERVLATAPTETAGQIRNRARRELAKVDPEALIARVRRSREERGVWCRPGQTGVTDWFATLPNEVSAQCWAAVDELARRYRADGDVRNLDQARADAMADLMLGHATVTTTMTFAVPAVAPAMQAHPATNTGTWRTPLGLPTDGAPSPAAGVQGDAAGDPDTLATHDLATYDRAIDIPGIGVVPAEVVRQIATAFGTRAVFALCDWQTGALASEECDVYRPPPWLDRLVKARDGTCRFFGCTVPATRCDVDHVVASPVGPTDKTNLMCLCRHHHRLKQQLRWHVEMTPDGVVTWTTPIGDQFSTWPIDHLDHPGRPAPPPGGQRVTG